MSDVNPVELARRLRILFASAENARVLNDILDYAGVYGLPLAVNGIALDLFDRGVFEGGRRLALDIAIMAGRAPEIRATTAPAIERSDTATIDAESRGEAVLEPPPEDPPAADTPQTGSQF